VSNDGGPAFPVSELHKQMGPELGHLHRFSQTGMSLRDYFAAAALTGMLAGGKDREPNHWVFGHVDEMACESYRIASHMLDERERRSQMDKSDQRRKILESGPIQPADPPHNEPEVKQRFVGMVGDLVELEYGVPEDHYRLILVRGSKSVTTEIDLLNVTEEDALGTLNMHLLRSIKAHKRYRERYGIPNG